MTVCIRLIDETGSADADRENGRLLPNRVLSVSSFEKTFRRSVLCVSSFNFFYRPRQKRATNAMRRHQSYRLVIAEGALTNLGL